MSGSRIDGWGAYERLRDGRGDPRRNADTFISTCVANVMSGSTSRAHFSVAVGWAKKRYKELTGRDYDAE